MTQATLAGAAPAPARMSAQAPNLDPAAATEVMKLL
jgi:hypothetical protein